MFLLLIFTGGGDVNEIDFEFPAQKFPIPPFFAFCMLNCAFLSVFVIYLETLGGNAEGLDADFFFELCASVGFFPYFTIIMI